MQPETVSWSPCRGPVGKYLSGQASEEMVKANRNRGKRPIALNLGRSSSRRPRFQFFSENHALLLAFPPFDPGSHLVVLSRPSTHPKGQPFYQFSWLMRSAVHVPGPQTVSADLSRYRLRFQKPKQSLRGLIHRPPLPSHDTYGATPTRSARPFQATVLSTVAFIFHRIGRRCAVLLS